MCRYPLKQLQGQQCHRAFNFEQLELSNRRQYFFSVCTWLSWYAKTFNVFCRWWMCLWQWQRRMYSPTAFNSDYHFVKYSLLWNKNKKPAFAGIAHHTMTASQQTSNLAIVVPDGL